MIECRWIILSPHELPLPQMHQSRQQAIKAFLLTHGMYAGNHYQTCTTLQEQREAWRFWNDKGYKVVPATIMYRTQ